MTSAVHDAELFTVAPDELALTFVTDEPTAVTTRIGDVEVVTEGTHHVARATGLAPATRYTIAVDGVAPSDLLPEHATTLPEPPGRHVATIATVNDVHFGEVECGRLGTPEELGPVFTTNDTHDGHTPYWSIMNRGAIDEIEALDPDAVIAKGDLTNVGAESEYEMFLDAYGRLGERMYHVRGNHDAMTSPTIACAHAPFSVDVGGATLAVLDTVRPGTDRGRIPPAQLEWLDALGAATTGPLFVFGHHHPWDPNSADRSETYFGINPDDSEALCAIVDRHECIVGYFAGHTHRNRVRHFKQARDIPIVEVACVKDYPGAWAEYRLHEGGYTQIVRRISTPDALDWTEKTRHMFAGLYRDYALGSLQDRCFTSLY